MAGIYIHNMTFPESPTEATFATDADGHKMLLVYTDKNSPEIHDVTVVEDHGDLGDIDDLEKRIREKKLSPLQEIFYTPTLIPGDKGEQQ